MGLFDALFGGKKRANVEAVPDHIWMTTAAKYAGLAREVDERSKSETVAILLIAHFPDVLGRLEELANQHTLDAPIRALLARNLNSDIAAGLNLDESAVIDIIVGERHPLPSVDDRLEEFADELPCRCRISHHISLDDAVIEIFAGEWIKKVLSQLGMSEDEAIESQMVSRRIRQAQQKIEGTAFGTVDADSATQWLEQNCPELGRR